MKKPKIGDICEIRTPTGLGYVQYTHLSKSMGELVRVLPGLYESRPSDFSRLAQEKELYFIFYTIRYVVRSRDVEIVSNQPVPEWAKPYPLMRLSWGTDGTGRTTRWKIADASVEWTLEDHRRIRVVTQLTPEQKKLSPNQLWPHPVMVRELARGWTPEREEELRLLDVAEAEEKARQGNTSPTGLDAGTMAHYLYFPKKVSAKTTCSRLRERGFEVEVRRGADGKSWLALARQQAPHSADRMEGLRDELESLAEELGGEYDGWELAVE